MYLACSSVITPFLRAVLYGISDFVLGVSMKVVSVAVAVGLGASMICAGCGSGYSVMAMSSPSISQVSPQVIQVGTPSATVMVQGSNFDSRSAVVFNGAAVPTTVVSSDTLAAQVGSGALSQPSVAQVLVRNSAGISSNSMPVTISSAQSKPAVPVLSITTLSLPAAGVGAPYSATLGATGGTPAYKWTVTAGSLPAGLGVSSAGVLSGTPSTAGTSTFTVQVQDSSTPAQSQSVGLTLVVSPAAATANPLSVNSVVFGPGQVGRAYNATLSASGGTPGYTWTITSGSLPAGLTLLSNGTISGTPTTAETSSFTVTASDSGSPVQTKSTNGSISISPSNLTITTTGLGSGKNSAPYSAQLAASGGTPGYSWSVSSGSLPTGLTLSSAGVISGTPNANGTQKFTVTVADSGSPVQQQSASFSIHISGTTLSIGSTALAAAQVGSAYSAALSVSGGTPAYAWSIASGSLPAGLTMSSAGVISGTPIVGGTSNFTVQVSDSSSPVQTTTAPATLTVQASALAISSTTLGAAKMGAAYNAILSASGGTPAYSWSIASGSLPSGLSLSSAGAISGTPSASGTSTFTVAVKDSGSPSQNVTASESITVSASTSPLTISSPTLAAGQVGAAYSGSFAATGGATAYTWSVLSGSLPAGLSLSAATGVISGTPTTSGTSSFTVQVADSSSPVQTQSVTVSLPIAAAAASTASGTTWYVRKDGGTRYSAAYTSGQCDGKTDAAYPGSGTNQHCAFNDVRYLWQDGTYYGYQSYSWIISGGDTVIIRGSIADGVSYRFGWDSASTYCPNGFPCFGYPGDSSDSGPPPLPSGTAGNPTRILGGNYGSCSAQSARTQIHGGYGLYAIFDVRGAAHLDMECLDLTDFAQCGRAGQAKPCNNSSAPYDDFAFYGLRFNNAIHDSTFTDIRIHGLAVEAIIGPVGDAVTLNRVDMIGNAGGGWNADDGTTGSGNLLVENFNISWNGCVEEYPLVHPLPYSQCTDDQSASHGGGIGYGDGFGTTTVAGTSAWHIKFSDGIVSYNTQDGIDALHSQGAGSTTDADRILAYGNMGNQIKIGADGNRSITNSVIYGNCTAMQGAVPGTPAGYNTLLSDFCRAGNEATIISMNDGSVATFAGNTVYGFRAGNTINSWGDLTGIICSSTCTTSSKIVYGNNVLVGFDPLNTGHFPAQYYIQDGYTSPFGIAGSVYRNNLKYNLSTACPDGAETNTLCATPQVVDTNWHAYGYGNVQPSSNSANVIGAGATLSGLTQDYTGATRGNPPSIGAYE